MQDAPSHSVAAGRRAVRVGPVRPLPTGRGACRYTGAFLHGLIAVAALVLSGAIASAAEVQESIAPPYTAGPKTRDGLGKYYFGREIAHFMTHEGAPWLDRPERDDEE